MVTWLATGNDATVCAGFLAVTGRPGHHKMNNWP
jgi:hypothetical protein